MRASGRLCSISSARWRPKSWQACMQSRRQSSCWPDGRRRSTTQIRMPSTQRDSPLTEPPVRLCCGMRHYGPQGPDGKVMCCLCFGRFDLDQLAEEDGKKTDVCSSCAIEDARGCLKRAADQLRLSGAMKESKSGAGSSSASPAGASPTPDAGACPPAAC